MTFHAHDLASNPGGSFFIFFKYFFTPVGKINIWNEHINSGDPSRGGGRDLAYRSEGPGFESRRGQVTPDSRETCDWSQSHGGSS